MNKAENVVVRLDKEQQAITENKDSNSKDCMGERNKNIESFFGSAAKNKLHQLTVQVTTRRINCRTIQIDGQEKIFFGSCSYLGLETDNRLINGAKNAVEKYGVQFSASRAFISLDIYTEIEDLLFKIFDAYPIVFPTTTLGHLSALPALIGSKDAIILDKQVHNSVQLAANTCRTYGTQIAVIDHNNMEQLEEAILNINKTGASRIWYMADGVYSMYGDLAPVEDIIKLLDKYDNFYTYIDDAHGMSWTGKLGRGFVLGERNIHPKMVVAFSLSKALGAGGGAIIVPNQEWQQKIRTVGPTMIFSGPIQPAVLGALEASLRLHVSGEIEKLQQELRDKIIYFRQLLQERDLYIESSASTPIIYVVIGSPDLAHQVVKKVLSSGYYAIYTAYPAVPKDKCGIRITINCHLTKSDMLGFADVLAQAISKYKKA